MLKDFFRGSSASTEAPDAAPKPSTRMNFDPERPLDDSEVAMERRRQVEERKRSELLAHDPTKRRKQVTYDSFFQTVQSLLLEESNSEAKEGVQVSLSRRAMNAMITSKFILDKPNTSEWEVNLQMNGYTDVVGASWSTANKYQLMYQNVSPFGSLFVAQLFAQTKGAVTQGSVFSMFQYPWSFGGCTQFTYLKGQFVSLNHVQRIVQGIHFGSNLTIIPSAPNNNVDLSHAISFGTPNRDAMLVAEVSPMKGAWRVAALSKEWGLNCKSVVELGFKEVGEGKKAGSLKMGLKRYFVGGANITTSLSNFENVDIDAVLPFGGSISGLNQLKMQLRCKYEMRTGAMKHSIIFTA